MRSPVGPEVVAALLGRRRSLNAKALEPRSCGGSGGLRLGVVLAAVVALLVAGVVSSPPRAEAGTNPVTIRVLASDGAGQQVAPGRSCADGGQGAYWHYGYSTQLAPGVFSSLASEALVHLNLHSDTQRHRNTTGVYPGGTNPSAFLLTDESHASLLNDRGSLKVRLRSAPDAPAGSCQTATLDFDGSVARHPAGVAGTWEVDSGSGAYRDVTGAGTFRLGDPATGTGAEVNPGADNALDLLLNGALEVPEPDLSVEVAGTYWGGLGLDYLTRRVTVVYKVTNTGLGDSFGARVVSVTSPTPGVQPIHEPAGVLGIPLGPDPANTNPVRFLGDLRVGEKHSKFFSIRFELGVAPGSPCELVILGCVFDSTVDVDMPDALDNPHTRSGTVSVEAPLLPPPL